MLRLGLMRECHLPYARAMIAHMIRRPVVLGIYPDLDESTLSGAWHLFDTILFALHCKSLICAEFTSSAEQVSALFPLMSVVLSTA